MHLNKRRRFVGPLVAFVAAAAASAVALPAQALSVNDPLLSPCNVSGNVVVNCGFEASTATPVPGWTHTVVAGGNTSDVTTFHNSGSNSLRLGATNHDDVWTQTVSVSPNTDYLVGGEFYATMGAGSSPQDDITMTASNVATHPGVGTNIFTSTNANFGWSREAAIVHTGSGRTMTLTLSGSNVPGQSYVDDVFVIAQRSGCAAIANNLVRNCGFEAATTSPWVHSVDVESHTTSTGNGGATAIDLASTTSTYDVWYQVLAVRPHTQYTLTYWVEYWSNGGPVDNDLKVQVSNVATSGGSLIVTTHNVPDHFWAPVTKTFTTGGGTTAVLMFSGRNKPDVTNVDDFSVTAVPHVKLSAKGHKLTTTVTGLGGQKVQLQRYVHKKWKVFASFTAPKSGWSTSFKVTVPAGKYRGVSLSAPGYPSATSASLTVH